MGHDNLLEICQIVAYCQTTQIFKDLQTEREFSALQKLCQVQSEKLNEGRLHTANSEQPRIDIGQNLAAMNGFASKSIAF